MMMVLLGFLVVREWWVSPTQSRNLLEKDEVAARQVQCQQWMFKQLGLGC